MASPQSAKSSANARPVAPVAPEIPHICANCISWQPLAQLPYFGQCMLSRKALAAPAIRADLDKCGAFDPRPAA
jgi:hypothetical protein